jgi:hypothetical protein
MVQSYVFLDINFICFLTHADLSPAPFSVSPVWVGSVT